MTTVDNPSVSPNTTPSRYSLADARPLRAGADLDRPAHLPAGRPPAIFGLDRSPVVGFVQISVFLVGLAIICLGGYIGLMAFWRNGERTIAAEIGSRLVATGYVVAVFSGMADVFGFGTQTPPLIPVFGPWQAAGVQIGEFLIAIGFLLLIPFTREKKADIN